MFLPFQILPLVKSLPFGVEPRHTGHYREYTAGKPPLFLKTHLSKNSTHWHKAGVQTWVISFVVISIVCSSSTLSSSVGLFRCRSWRVDNSCTKKKWFQSSITFSLFLLLEHFRYSSNYHKQFGGIFQNSHSCNTTKVMTHQKTNW